MAGLTRRTHGVNPTGARDGWNGTVNDLAAIDAAYAAWNDGDAEALVGLAAEDIVIEPLVASVATSGPWHGHAGVRRLVEESRGAWHEFAIRCDDVVEFEGGLVVFVHVTAVVHEGATRIEGDIAHVLQMRDGLVTRLTAYRDRDAALAAAGHTA